MSFSMIQELLHSILPQLFKLGVPFSPNSPSKSFHRAGFHKVINVVVFRVLGKAAPQLIKLSRLPFKCEGKRSDDCPVRHHSRWEYLAEVNVIDARIVRHKLAEILFGQIPTTFRQQLEF
jgi:hypothetical protein